MKAGTYEFQPKDVCSRKMRMAIDEEGKILSFEVEGGCQGNLRGIGRLLKGRDVREVADLLSGVECRGSRTKATSCPDQLSQAIRKEILGE